MAFTKIIDTDLEGKGVTGLPDTPQLTTSEMQKKFDEIAKDVIVPKFNKLSGELSDNTAAANIGATSPTGISASSENAQAVLDAIASETLSKQPKESGKGLSTNDYSNSEKERLSEACNAKHSHVNSTVLNAITATVKQGYDRIVTLLKSITEVSDTVKNSSSSIPTGKAVSDYVATLGGGDMMRTVYDSDQDGVVDNSEKLGGKLPSYYQSVTDNSLVTESKTITGAINELAQAAPDTLDTLDEVLSATEPGSVPGALAMQEMYQALGDQVTFRLEGTTLYITMKE